MSAMTTLVRAPEGSISSATAAALGALRATITTWAPRSTRRAAVSRPSPEVAPVTTIRRPVAS